MKFMFKTKKSPYDDNFVLYILVTMSWLFPLYLKENFTKTKRCVMMYLSRKLAYNKKGYIWFASQMHSLMDVHLKSHCCEIRCFYYLNSKVITTKNNSRIIINRDNSLFVIINHHLSFSRKGKHLIYFKCIH